MKFFALLLMFAAMLLVAASQAQDEEMEACANCFSSPKDLVCAKKGSIVSTYYNKCLVECMNAELLHEKMCENENLTNNRLEEK